MQGGSQPYRYRVATPFGTFQRITSVPVAFLVVYEAERAGRRLGFAYGWAGSREVAERLAQQARASGAEPMIVAVSESDRRPWVDRPPRCPEE